MASITKRGSTWQYRVNNIVDGQKKPIVNGGFKTKREAQVAAAEVELSINKGSQAIVTWDIKFEMGFDPLKNEQSKRTISIDKNVLLEFKKLILALPKNEYN